MSIRSWWKRRHLDEEDFREEIGAHLAIAEAEKRGDSVDPLEARYAALREFGNVTLTTEAARRVWTPGWMTFLLDVVSDARYGVRALVRARGFSAAMIAVLAIGIGVNAGVFTIW
jgi:hypothetical protein